VPTFTSRSCRRNIAPPLALRLLYTPSNLMLISSSERRLGSKQGGTTNEYYHLTSAQHTIVSNTTASFTTADETKLDNITVTQAVNLDTMESDIAALANGMVYKGNWDAST